MDGSIVIAEAHNKQRLDQVLSARFPDFSRSRLQTLIRSGHITVNGNKVKPSYVVRQGDRLEYHIAESEPMEIQPQDIPLDVIYEDDHIMVINKPAGMVVHPGAGNTSGTVANALLFHTGLSAMPGQTLRPGIVHRLDKDTSGLLVLAKTTESHAGLSRAFANREVTKTYIAVCKGTGLARSFYVENRLIRSSSNRLKFTGRRGEGRHALTFFAVAAQAHGMTLCLARPKTGRTHQIRVHLSEMGHPIIGDDLYGGRVSGKIYAGLHRQALHAYRIVFVHPVTGKELVFESPPPQDMMDFIVRVFGHGFMDAVEEAGLLLDQSGALHG